MTPMAYTTLLAYIKHVTHVTLGTFLIYGTSHFAQILWYISHVTQEPQEDCCSLRYSPIHQIKWVGNEINSWD